MTCRSSAGSRPDVGSSRISNDGSVSSSIATEARFRCPPESARSGGRMALEPELSERLVDLLPPWPPRAGRSAAAGPRRTGARAAAAAAGAPRRPAAPAPRGSSPPGSRAAGRTRRTPRGRQSARRRRRAVPASVDFPGSGRSDHRGERAPLGGEVHAADQPPTALRANSSPSTWRPRPTGRSVRRRHQPALRRTKSLLPSVSTSASVMNAALDRYGVQQGAVQAVQVLDQEPAVGDDHPRVVPGHVDVVDHDVVVGRPCRA